MKKILLAGALPQDCVDMLEKQFELFKLYEPTTATRIWLNMVARLKG